MMIDCVVKTKLWNSSIMERRSRKQDWNNPKYDFCIDMMCNILGDMGDEQEWIIKLLKIDQTFQQIKIENKHFGI